MQIGLIIFAIIIILVLLLLIRLIFKTIKWVFIIGIILIVIFVFYGGYTQLFGEEDNITDEMDVNYRYGCENNEDCAFVLDNKECDLVKGRCNYVNLTKQDCNITTVEFNLSEECKCLNVEGKRGYCSNF